MTKLTSPHDAKAQLKGVEEHLAEIDDFHKMPREDVAQALSLSLECIRQHPDDAGCYVSAVQWYRVVGAKTEAQALIDKAPDTVKRSKDWNSINLTIP